jgi:hypothetical protein
VPWSRETLTCLFAQVWQGSVGVIEEIRLSEEGWS